MILISVRFTFRCFGEHVHHVLTFWVLLAVYMVLLHLHKSHGPANFFRFIDNKPEAISLFQLWAKDNAAELLRDFNYQDDRRTDSALLVLAEAYAIKVCKSRDDVAVLVHLASSFL